MRQAVELDPNFPAFRKNLGVVYSCGGEHELAIEQLQNVVQLAPASPASVDALFELGMAYLRKGMYPEAIAQMEKVRSIRPPYGEHLAGLAHAYAASGQRDEATRILKSLEKQEANGGIVASGFDGGLYPIYFALGERDHAFAWLDKAHRDRSDSLVYLRCWPEFESMRTDPQLSDLVRRVGIPP